MDMLKALSHTDHDKPYSDRYLYTILKCVKTIAVVGASPVETRASFRVLLALHQSGYDVIPINPRPGLEHIAGIRVYPSLASVDRPIDMVDVFRRSEDLYPVAEEAVLVGARVLWAQIGVKNGQAAKLAEAGGMKVVMDRCPKIELSRLLQNPNPVFET